MTKVRGFELIEAFAEQEDLLPQRETAHAAGYDLKVAEKTDIAPNEIVLVPTGVKAYMQDGEVLYLYDRSSNPRKKGLVLINSVGVIDGDYYNNEGNEGHIFAQMQNISDETVHLEKGDRIVQGVFAPFLVADVLTVFAPVDSVALENREGAVSSLRKNHVLSVRNVATILLSI